MKILISKKTKRESDGFCNYIGVGTLKDYIETLPSKYDSLYCGAIDAEYRNELMHDILLRCHTELITLGASSNDFEGDNLSNFKILNGLERTAEMKRAYNILSFIEKYGERISKENLEIKEILTEEIRSLKVKPSEILSVIEIIDGYGLDFNRLMEAFNENQWFEVWLDLTPEEETHKMKLKKDVIWWTNF